MSFEQFTSLNEIEFVIFDIETTGLSPENGDRIVEIGALRVKNGAIIDEFSSLVNPQRENSAYFINNICDADLEKAPLIKDVMPKFLSFAKNSCLVAYNVKFDLSFIQKEAGGDNTGLWQDWYIIDAMFIAKHLLLKSSNLSLKNAAYFLGLNIHQKHRGLADCKLTNEVFKRLIEMLKDVGIEDFLEFYSIFGYNKVPLTNFIQEKLSLIKKAINNKQNIKIRYLSSSRMEINEREITPHSIRREYNKDLLSGFCHLRKEERKFNLNGILRLQVI